MRSHSLLHAPGRHLPCARTSFSKLKPIICDNVSGNKDSPICRQDGREPQTERQRNQAAALPSACCFRARFGHAVRCRATSGRWKVVGRHPDTSCVVGRLLDAQTPPNVRILPENARDVRKPPENPAASGCRPRIPRRPDAARQMQRNYHNALDTQENAAMSASKDARLPHVRACFHVPNNFLTPEYPLRRYTIVT